MPGALPNGKDVKMKYGGTHGLAKRQADKQMHRL